MSKTKRVAIGAIFTECNHLGGVPIDRSWFERYELVRGEAILRIDNSVVGGMLQVLRAAGVAIAPLLWASTCPGGPLTADCYAQLKTELLDRLRQALPVDGVLLPLHGAAAAEGIGDLEGDLITAVRAIVGPDVPIVATLDLHAHISAAMVRDADALVAWETYPHADSYTTGQRGARLLVDTLAGRCRPTMAAAKVPVITGAIHGSTHGDDPFARLMRQAKAHEGQNGVLSTSVILVQPFLDVADMGSGAIVVTDNDQDGAVKLANELAEAYWAMRFELEPKTWTPDAAIAAGMMVAGGPVILVETADCCGGGAAGDSIATLAALLRTERQERSFVPVVDPAAAAACHAAGIGAAVTCTLGHQLDPRWGQPITVTGRVATLTDGRFRYQGGIYDGVEGNLGQTAVLTIGGIQVLITTYGTYDWRDEQYRSVGLDPATAKFVVAKNPMNYRLAYGPIAKAIFILDTPGPTPPTIRHAHFTQLQRPYFPLDAEIPSLHPTILT
ncbi:MAG: M81 family peptidase [Caldilinea sp. CFX5]|nr:M81 family peptidase [Caldilinea sp. CFX5]